MVKRMAVIIGLTILLGCCLILMLGKFALPLMAEAIVLMGMAVLMLRIARKRIR
jgi:hypothetical protein